jgi:hypothetical protein
MVTSRRASPSKMMIMPLAPIRRSASGELNMMLGRRVRAAQDKNHGKETIAVLEEEVTHCDIY